MPTISKKAKTLAFTNFVKSVERSNKKFAEASQDKKILMVSEDILKLLDLKRIAAAHGTYVEVPSNAVKIETMRGFCQLSDLLKMPELPSCNVCAIGGAMLASTLRLNKVKIYNPKDGFEDLFSNRERNSMSTRAIGIFGERLLRLMEEAFETGEFGYRQVREGNNRLRSIYKNLVKHKGKRFTAFRNQLEVWPQMAKRFESRSNDFH